MGCIVSLLAVEGAGSYVSWWSASCGVVIGQMGDVVGLSGKPLTYPASVLPRAFDILQHRAELLTMGMATCFTL